MAGARVGVPDPDEPNGGGEGAGEAIKIYCPRCSYPRGGGQPKSVAVWVANSEFQVKPGLIVLTIFLRCMSCKAVVMSLGAFPLFTNVSAPDGGEQNGAGEPTTLRDRALRSGLAVPH